jgi:CheY-like chemotaxis protein
MKTIPFSANTGFKAPCEPSRLESRRLSNGVYVVLPIVKWVFLRIVTEGRNRYAFIQKERELTVQPYHIILVDDHAAFREGLRKVLGERKDIRIVGEAADGLELLNLMQMGQLLPKMVIIDITMPNLGGIETTSQVKMDYPDMKVLILTIHKDREYVDVALSAGADGYLLKEDAHTVLFSAIETIRQGGAYVSPLLSENLEGKR